MKKKIYLLKELKGLRSEIIASKVIKPKDNEDMTWNDALSKCVRLLDNYIKKEGWFSE